MKQPIFLPGKKKRTKKNSSSFFFENDETKRRNPWLSNQKKSPHVSREWLQGLVAIHLSNQITVKPIIISNRIKKKRPLLVRYSITQKRKWESSQKENPLYILLRELGRMCGLFQLKISLSNKFSIVFLCSTCWNWKPGGGKWERNKKSSIVLVGKNEPYVLGSGCLPSLFSHVADVCDVMAARRECPFFFLMLDRKGKW